MQKVIYQNPFEAEEKTKLHFRERKLYHFPSIHSRKKIRMEKDKSFIESHTAFSFNIIRFLIENFNRLTFGTTTKRLTLDWISSADSRICIANG